MGFLKNIFGPTKAEIWQQVADEIGGDFIDGGFWKGAKLHYYSGDWEIVLDTYTQSHGKSSTTYTRMRAPFMNEDGFHFRIHPSNIFSEIGKSMGMQDIEVGDPYFDKKYIIRGNDEERVRKLLSDDKLKQYIDLQPDISFRIDNERGVFKKNYVSGETVLNFWRVGVMKDVNQLKALFLLFAHTLYLLCNMDSAYEDTLETDDPFAFLQ